MTTLRSAAKQALELLERLHGGCTDSDDGTVEAITVWCPEIIDDLRAALAEPVQEPVAWMIYTEGGTSAYVTDNPNDLVGAYRALALYTAPFQRKPLTEEEILSVLRLAPPEPSLWPHLKDEAVVGDVQKAVLAIARAIERAHGIGGSDE